MIWYRDGETGVCEPCREQWKAGATAPQPDEVSPDHLARWAGMCDRRMEREGRSGHPTSAADWHSLAMYLLGRLARLRTPAVPVAPSGDDEVASAYAEGYGDGYSEGQAGTEYDEVEAWQSSEAFRRHAVRIVGSPSLPVAPSEPEGHDPATLARMGVVLDNICDKGTWNDDDRAVLYDLARGATGEGNEDG